MDSYYWKIPFILASKPFILGFLLVVLSLFSLDNNYFSYKIYIAINCVYIWIITMNYFVFRLVYLSGINQYKKYSKFILYLMFFSWIGLILSILNPDFFIKSSLLTENFLIFIFFMYSFVSKIKFKVDLERIDSWIVSLFYLIIPIMAFTVISILTENKIIFYMQRIVLVYIAFVSLYQSLIISISEHSRLGKLREDMEKRNLEILKFAEKAKESTRLKGEFLANMSHELRTPLNGILGSANLLVGTKLNQEQRDYLETLRICGNNLLVIINEILDYSKIEANKLELEHIPFEINSCIENVFELLAPAAAAQETELIYAIDLHTPNIVVGDYTRIQQVTTHLVDNAIKFTKNGHAFVKVKMEIGVDKKHMIKFDVIDTGSGISRKDIGKLFKTFSQIDDSSTRKYGGTGLGLSIAKRLTELMGGSIGVKSELGKGSVFTFTVLVDFPEQENDEKEKNNQIKRLQIQNKVLCIVEKNIFLANAMQQTCENWGMEVYLAASEQEALAIPLQSPPTYVLISTDDFDYDMLRTKLVEKYLDQQIIFIAMLKNSNIYYSENKVYPKNFASIINKPIRYSQLFDALIETVSEKQNGQLKQFGVDLKKLSDIYPIRILVAEDNVVNQKLITNMLKKYGYICDIVANGNEVLEALTRNIYDIIFMDVQMPDLDGIEATKKIILKYPKSSTRPHIIAMTAHARGAEGQVCLDAGMEGYLGKPIDMKELKQVLEFWGNKVNKIKSSS